MLRSLHPELIRVGSDSETKEEILIEISDLVGRICSDATSGEIFRALTVREQLSSTALGNGIAIPHCTFENVKEFYIGALIVNGVDFDSLDGVETKVIFFSVGPKCEQKKHIATLTSISKIGLDPALLNSLENAQSAEEVYALLKTESEDEDFSGQKCQFLIQVQDEKLFNDVLEVLTSDVEGAISVIDANSPGTYLNKLPLFSSFWNETTERFNKIIVAIIDRRLMNDTVRRINLLQKSNGAGLYITVNELLYFSGSLEY